MTEHARGELLQRAMLHLRRWGASGIDGNMLAAFAVDEIARAAPVPQCEAEPDIRWAVNVLLEKIAEKFEGWETHDIWRSDAAMVVRGFKHDLATPRSRSDAPLSADERHAIGHARHLTQQTTAENPECCFHRDLVKDLLRIIDRAIVPPPSEAGREAMREALEKITRLDSETWIGVAKNIAKAALSPNPGAVAVPSTNGNTP